jgi:hypothetical protein
VTSGIALDMLHQEMLFVSQRRIHKAFKMGRDEGTFDVIVYFVINFNRS